MYLVQDPAWKFGCGRYIQKPGAILELTSEIRRLGTKALVVAGNKAWNAVNNIYPDAFAQIPHELQLHSAPCSEEAARSYSEIVTRKELNVIVGVGGGKIMDLAKLIGELTGKPVINVPTICATCAAFTPLSVIYTPEGKARGSWFYENEVACIIADTTILARQPSRFAFAGIADSLAKEIEIEHNMHYLDRTPDIRHAQYNAHYLYERLMDIALKIPAALEKGEPSSLIDELIYLTIPATGMVSGIARGQGQSAVAHTLYETARTLYTREAAEKLHGEIVGVGLRIQQRYDDKPTDVLDAAMRKLKLPMTLHDLDIPVSDEQIQLIAETMRTNPLMKDQDIQVDRMIKAIHRTEEAASANG